MSTGYYFGGREMTATEARAAGLPVGESTQHLPRVTVPRYQTGDQLFTREDLLQMFEADWGSGINSGDVDAFIKRHFWERTYAVPTAYVPYPPMPDIPEGLDDRERSRIVSDYEQGRSASRKARELYRIDSLPKFVPSYEYPSVNDDARVNAARADRINNL